MYGKVLIRSFMSHKTRFILPAVALLIGISVGSGLIMVTLDVEDEIASELRAFGPNIVVLPRSEDIELNVGGIPIGTVSETNYIAEKDAQLIRDLPLDVFGDKVKGILGKNALLYSIVKVDNRTELILGGTWFDQLERINLWWELEGSYPTNGSTVLLGHRAAATLKKGLGDPIRLSYSETTFVNGVPTLFEREMASTISGIVMTGGDDDSRVFADLDAVQNLTNKEGMVSIMHISALCNECPVEDVAEIIEGQIPGIEVRTVKQVAMAEMDTLNIVKDLVGMITIVALAASVLVVMTTMALGVVERRREIALMKTVGATNLDIMSLILAEGLIVALISGSIGFWTGLLTAQIIGSYVFDSGISARFEVLPLSIAVSALIVLVASIIPVRMAMRIEPALLMRRD
ncbi:MAG: ABC transporter permease [Candidatus Thermoplasmatota archaeon]|jgi:putative ABC transport system permease protein|nr:ABC transporter permease [Candidatus Thermoplasmatota archaeon]